MTVISALITRYGTAHASDSLLTKLKPDGSREVVEDRRTKLVHVKHWRGALAYWGLAQCGNWSTLEWLRGRSGTASQFSSPEAFANALAVDLNDELAKFAVPNTSDKGLGIHFTAYERMNDRWIPELFLISNWEGIPYTKIRPTGVGASRETYHTLKNVPSAPEHRNVEFRVAVYEALQWGTMFRYNNGDPELFNPIANAILDAFFALTQRGILDKPSNEKTHCALVRRPIEVASRLVGDFSGQGTRIIGGKPHDLCILSSGQCWSSTGDCQT